MQSPNSPQLIRQVLRPVSNNAHSMLLCGTAGRSGPPGCSYEHARSMQNFGVALMAAPKNSRSLQLHTQVPFLASGLQPSTTALRAAALFGTAGEPGPPCCSC
eukprot:471389-Pelagomonas_calceolata.AAC.2